MVALALLFWGAWGIFDKKALEHTSPLGQLVAIYCFSPIFALILVGVLSITTPGWHLTSHTILNQAFGSLCYFVATIAYLIAMNKGEASLILGATAGYPLLSQILAFIMLAEPLIPVRLLGCALVVGGIIAITGSAKSTQISGVKSEGIDAGWKPALPGEPVLTANGGLLSPSIVDRDLLSVGALSADRDPNVVALGSDRDPNVVALCADRDPNVVALGADRDVINVAAITAHRDPLNLMAMADRDPIKTAESQKALLLVVFCVLVAVSGWAFRGMFDKIALDHAGPWEVYLGKFVCDTVLAMGTLIWVLLRRPDVKLLNPKLYPWAVGSALCLAGGSAAYYVALSLLSASYVVSITGCYPLFMYLLALLVLKERFSLSRAVGIALIVAGGIVTQLTQGS